MDAEKRRSVALRAGGRCEYCWFPEAYSVLPFQVDHLIAEKHGGGSGMDNLAFSCERCNSHKGPNIAGLSAGRAIRLFNPRIDRWEENFEWDGAVLVARTEIGAVTIDVLAINQRHRVSVRAALMEEGVHPR